LLLLSNNILRALAVHVSFLFLSSSFHGVLLECLLFSQGSFFYFGVQIYPSRKNTSHLAGPTLHKCALILTWLYLPMLFSNKLCIEVPGGMNWQWDWWILCMPHPWCCGNLFSFTEFQCTAQANPLIRLPNYSVFFTLVLCPILAARESLLINQSNAPFPKPDAASPDS
jgi:hypothetical protein